MHIHVLLVLALLLTTAAFAAAPATQPSGGALGFTVQDIKGSDVDLQQYRGKVALIVNVASKCGHTPQYEQLEQVYQKYRDQGFVVLGFPANDFGQQEPGTNEEIAQFCSTRFKVTFPMFSKISVKGADKSPLYEYLTSKEKNGPFAGEIGWNFTKFLVGRDGQVVARFDSGTRPDSPDVIAAVETELKKLQ